METKRAEAIGQFDLFGDRRRRHEHGRRGSTSPIPVGEWDKTALLAYEREMLGLYVSDHPLLRHRARARRRGRLLGRPAHADDDRQDGAIVTIGGLISALQRKVTKQGDAWAIATVEDLEGAIEVHVLPATYQLRVHQLAEDAVVLVRGRLDKREDAPRLIAMEFTVPDVTDGPRGPVVITLPAARCTPPVVERLKEVLATHPGTTEVQLQLQQRRGRTTVLRLDDRLRVTARRR